MRPTQVFLLASALTLLATPALAEVLTLSYSGRVNTAVKLDLSAGGDNPFGGFFGGIAGMAGCNVSLTESVDFAFQATRNGNQWQVNQANLGLAGGALDGTSVHIDKLDVGSGALSLRLSYTVMAARATARYGSIGSSHCEFAGPVEQEATLNCSFDPKGVVAGKSCALSVGAADSLNPINISSNGTLPLVAASYAGGTGGGPVEVKPQTLEQACAGAFKLDAYVQACKGSGKTVADVQACQKNFAQAGSSFAKLVCVMGPTTQTDACRLAFADLPAGNPGEQECLAEYAAGHPERVAMCSIYFESPYKKLECMKFMTVKQDQAMVCLQYTAPYGDAAFSECLKGESVDSIKACGAAAGYLTEGTLKMCKEWGVEAAGRCARAFGSVTPGSAEETACKTESSDRLQACTKPFLFSEDKLKCLAAKQTSVAQIQECDATFTWMKDKLDCVLTGGVNPRKKYCGQVFSFDEEAKCVNGTVPTVRSLEACAPLGPLTGRDCARVNPASATVKYCHSFLDKIDSIGFQKCLSKNSKLKAEVEDFPGMTDQIRATCKANNKCFDKAVSCLQKKPADQPKCLTNDVFSKTWPDFN